MRTSKSTRVHGARVWLTRAQIAAKYNDPKVADLICNAKLEDPDLKERNTKFHEDAPGVEARPTWGIGHVDLLSIGWEAAHAHA